ncbi:uncharacterized protein LOC122922899 [Bufo gargarizans]|uniref:uncharacterized protein LOC122922899 n=1 Tax=Bufo gargarizans TaxID=30331 RepID=UPI001CF116F4|nr:uncharacterized protein LOC122922899 [Bufo gargarizans]
MAHKLVLILGALEGVLSQETQKRELHTNPGSHVNLPYARTLLNGTKIQVYQTPEVHATPGSDVTLPCTYNVSGVEEATIGSFTWYRHLVKTGPEVCDSNKDFTGRISKADTEQFTSNRDAHITIHNVLDTDAGRYFCAVRFLEGGRISGSGAGTLLNVTGVLSQETQKRELHTNPGSHVNLPYARTLLNGTKIQVYQTPEVHATPGSDVTLPCTYNVSGVEEATIGSFTWYRYLVKTGPEVSDSNKDFTGRISRADTEQFTSNRDAHITIHNVVDTDAGSYFCAVRFLEGGRISGSGAGTLLIVTGFLSMEIQVYQIPEVHATPGNDVTLPCTYNVSGVEEATIGSYKWYRHLVKTGPEVSDSNKDFTGRISRADAAEFISNRDAHVTIHNVDPSHSGIYFCQVIFQHGKEITGVGNGTLLNVTVVPQKMLGICVLLKAAGLLLIVLMGLVACIFRLTLSCVLSRDTRVSAESSSHGPSSTGTCSLSPDQPVSLNHPTASLQSCEMASAS